MYSSKKSSQIIALFLLCISFSTILASSIFHHCVPTITATNTSALELSTDALVFFVYDNGIETLCKSVKSRYPELEHFLRQAQFAGKTGSMHVLPVISGERVQHIVCVGLGTAQNNCNHIEAFRRAVGSAVKELQRSNLATAVFVLPDALPFGVTIQKIVQETATCIHRALYAFDDYFSLESKKIKQDLQVTLCVTDQINEVEQALHQGIVIGQCINNCRHWIDLPACTLTPSTMADYAQKIADEHQLSLTVFNQEQIMNMGMGGLAAVSSGSAQECKLVVLEYKAPISDAPTISFVGKGITFDSGGLSLKTTSGMRFMKRDMSGAAAVIGAMQAIAQLKPNVHVVGLAALAENMTGCAAFKVGDIVRFYNGLTAEIIDTDAEGRLVLADALSYAVQQYKLDAIVDLATLTGACKMALGQFYSGLMSSHDNLVEKIENASKLSGDRVWRLPLDIDFKKANESKVADIANFGKESYFAGSITAALFLQNFVDDVPWAHLDIAGTAFGVPDISYYSDGATGAGVPLLVALADEFSQLTIKI